MSQPLSGSQRRLFRALAAQRLADLAAGKADVSTDAISWQTLDTLPHWCLQTSQEQRSLQLLGGGLFLAPALKTCINGEKLRIVQGLVGKEELQAVLAEQPVSSALPDLESIDDMQGLLLGCGAAVLLGSLQEKTVALLYAESLGEPYGELAADTADVLYRRAATLQLRLAPPATPDNTAELVDSSGMLVAEADIPA